MACVGVGRARRIIVDLFSGQEQGNAVKQCAGEAKKKQQQFRVIKIIVNLTRAPTEYTEIRV